MNGSGDANESMIDREQNYYFHYNQLMDTHTKQ